ncbi:MAG: hypothetical protein HY040_26935 [Planctomycetes bacterium]|nr:hypothetical protein [Planctomycetota bacterium]
MRWFCPTLLLFLAPLAIARAQTHTPAEQLLRCVPPDYGIGFLLNDLRGHSERCAKLPWVKSLEKSALLQAFLTTPEYQKIVKLQTDFKTHLGVDWPTLRDDILGDAAVFAFHPTTRPEGADKAGSNKADDEQGLILLQARKPDLLAGLIDRLNTLQKKSGELTKLEDIAFKGVKYFRRVTNKDTHYYMIQGGFLAVSGAEDALRQVIERRRESSSELPGHLAWASKQSSVLTAWLNPRFFDKELLEKSQAKAPDAEFVKAFVSYWQALDVLGVSFHVGDSLEVRFSLQAREKDLPPAAQKLFREPARPSELWSRFPENAIATIAGRIDPAAVVESLADSLPPPYRNAMMEGLNKSVGAALGLSVLKDVLPNLGPDWGVCVLPAADAGQWPQAIAALAVRPGDKKVDQAMLEGMNLAARAAVFLYNQNHAANPMRFHTIVQDKIEVRYLVNDKAFPAGFQPAFALKDGYLVLASSPAAIVRFKAGAGQTPPGGEALLMRLSSTETAKLLRNQRQIVIDHIAEKNQISKQAAAHGLDGALSVLDLIDRIELSERAGSGEVAWTLRIRPSAR